MDTANRNDPAIWGEPTGGTLHNGLEAPAATPRPSRIPP
jgi:hypothetical protein